MSDRLVDVLVQSLTAFDGLADMELSMSRGYVPTLKPYLGSGYAQRNRDVMALRRILHRKGYRVFPAFGEFVEERSGAPPRAVKYRRARRFR